MYTERGGGGWLNSLAREEGRVALAGVGLVFLHTAFIEEPLVVTVIRKMTLIVKTSYLRVLI